MAKSAMEALNRRFEEESGDTNVDIEVIVNADGEAAEDIIEAADAGEAAAETEAIAEENTEATQEANDMAELAATLRQYGLTPGMAAILKVTVPLSAYGISLPAMESLDSSGRNQAVADRIANRLETAVESFWDSTKDFFRKMVNQIVRAIQWIWHRIGNIKTRVERAHSSLQNRSWDTELAKDHKYKHLNDNDDVVTALNALTKGCAEVLKDLREHVKGKTSGPNANWGKKLQDELTADNLKKGIGYKYKDKSPDEVESDTSVKLDLKEDDATEDAFRSYQNGAAWTAVGKTLTSIRVLENVEKAANDVLANFKSFGKDSKADAGREVIDKARSRIATVSKVIGQVTKMYNKTLMTYVTGCSQLRVCTRPSHEE